MRAIETFIAREESAEATTLMQFEKELNPIQQRELLIFLQGAIFMKHLANLPREWTDTRINAV